MPTTKNPKASPSFSFCCFVFAVLVKNSYIKDLYIYCVYLVIIELCVPLKMQIISQDAGFEYCTETNKQGILQDGHLSWPILLNMDGLP